MPTVETKPRAPSIIPSAGTCASSPDDLLLILQIVRDTHSHGAGKWLERVTGASPRTVDYWLAGTYLPRGNRGLAIITALRAEHEARGRLLQQFELDLRSAP